MKKSHHKNGIYYVIRLLYIFKKSKYLMFAVFAFESKFSFFC